MSPAHYCTSYPCPLCSHTGHFTGAEAMAYGRERAWIDATSMPAPTLDEAAIRAEAAREGAKAERERIVARLRVWAETYSDVGGDMLASAADDLEREGAIEAGAHDREGT